jgi:hypothetical protein
MLIKNVDMEATLGIIISENLIISYNINYNSFGSLSNGVECYK